MSMEMDKGIGKLIETLSRSKEDFLLLRDDQKKIATTLLNLVVSMINEISELAKGGGELTMPSSDEFGTPIQERRRLIPTPEELKAEQKELDAKLQVNAAQMALAAYKKYVASLGKQSPSGPLTEQDLGEGRMRTFVDAILRKSGWKPHHIFDGREYWGWTLVAIEDKCSEQELGWRRD